MMVVGELSDDRPGGPVLHPYLWLLWNPGTSFARVGERSVL
jgi:hypothetical protein